MNNLIEIIDNMDIPTATSCAYQVGKQLIQISNESEAAAKWSKDATALSKEFPEYSESIMMSGTRDANAEGELAKNFLKTIVELDSDYATLVDEEIRNPKKIEPFTMMVVAGAIVFILQTKFKASYKGDKLTIDIEKKATSDSLVKKVFNLGGAVA